MRLTLRTLLAYLDDRLSPSNAREIGQKITNSPFATELTERIREVKRRRRLAAPSQPQPVIEANLIADYLDDQLTPELVARVEREILSSDASLAEVAAAHEILGMIRDPVTVEPRLRDRLYSLDPTGAMDVVHALAAGQTGRAVIVPESKWSPLASRVAASRRLPGVIVAALGLLWLVSVVSDSDLLGRKQDAAGASGGKPAAAENSSITDAGGLSEVPQDSVNPEATVANSANGGNNVETMPVNSLPDVLSTSPPNSDSESASLPVSGIAVAAADPTTPVASTPAAVAPEVVVAEPVPDAVAAVAADESAEPPSVFLHADSRIVLILDEQQNRWSSLTQIAGGEVIGPAPNRIDCRPLLGRNWFGIPGLFRLVVSTDSAGWSAAFPGAALIRIHEGDLSGLDILSGRMLLRADKLIAWNEQSPPRFALGTGSQTTELTLQTPDTLLGIEVIAVADGLDSDPAAAVAENQSILPMDADLQVRLTLVEGSIVMKSPASDADLPVAKGQSVSWRILGMTGFSALTPENGSSLAATPAWLFEGETADVPETVNLKHQLLEALSKGAEPGDAVLTLFDERNPQAGVMAVHVLSLTRDVERLLAVIFEPRDESVHRAAIDGLSGIAASSVNGRESIRRSLETRLPMAEVDLMLRLIKGLSAADAGDAKVSSDLMDLLSSDRLLTRTLTIYRMEQVTNDRMGYHPAAEAARRREAIRRWQKYLDRNQGKLLP